MHQVKIFHDTEENVLNLEQEINNWLTESGAQVVSIQGNIAPQTVIAHDSPSRISFAQEGASRRFAPSDILIVVLYNKA